MLPFAQKFPLFQEQKISELESVVRRTVATCSTESGSSANEKQSKTPTALSEKIQQNLIEAVTKPKLTLVSPNSKEKPKLSGIENKSPTHGFPRVLNNLMVAAQLSPKTPPSGILNKRYPNVQTPRGKLDVKILTYEKGPAKLNEPKKVYSKLNVSPPKIDYFQDPPNKGGRITPDVAKRKAQLTPRDAQGTRGKLMSLAQTF